MEDWVHVHRHVPTPLDHSTAAVTLDIHCPDMPAMVRVTLMQLNHNAMCTSVIENNNFRHRALYILIACAH